MSERSGAIGATDRFRLSGELHYFRIPRAAWRDRLARILDMGLDTVSTYVPWNWHQPSPDARPDFGGSAIPERDLHGFLDSVAAEGLACIFRPGPYITAEWRDGGLPRWLWRTWPDILARDARNGPTERRRDEPGGNYPAITYRHPRYEAEVRRWLDAAFAVAGPYQATRGGPIVNVQLDDEPSYWHQLPDPTAVDYNPVLVASDGGPSTYARWLMARHGSLGAVNRACRTAWRSPLDVEPPRTRPVDRSAIPEHLAWLAFKLDQVNGHVRFLYAAAREDGIDVPVSMLQPYLRPLLAPVFADDAIEHGIDIELTNECYAGLFGASAMPEQKVGSVVVSHELYHMWRRGLGPAFTMELQASNSSFLAPGPMEELYALTIGRGIKGVSFFMLAGGENPPGYEHVTGPTYDVSAPLSRDGRERPHAATIRKLVRIVDAGGPDLIQAVPLRDVWIGWDRLADATALVGGPAGDSAEVLERVFSDGAIGLSDALSLPALLALSSLSFGCLDLATVPDRELAAARQLWVPGLEMMTRVVQERLRGYVDSGGHLVLLPHVPRLDERFEPCEILAAAAFGGAVPAPEIAGPLDDLGGDGGLGVFRTVRADDDAIVAHGPVTTFAPDPGVDVIAVTADGNLPCAFRRHVGAGTITVLGFRLAYVPNESEDHARFLVRLAESAGVRRHCWTTHPATLAMQIAGRRGSFVVVVNPSPLPAATRVGCMDRDGGRRLFPAGIDVAFPGQGARILPVDLVLDESLALAHASWELVGRRHDGGGVDLRLAAGAPGDVGEVAIDGRHVLEAVRGADVVSSRAADGVTVYLLRADGGEVSLRLVRR